MSFLVINTDNYSASAIGRLREVMADESFVEENEPLILTEQHDLYKSLYRALNPKSDVSDPNSDAQLTLDAMMPVGKKISVGLEITDTDRAQMLFGTMYDQHLDFFGVKVYSWGAFDVQKAQERRISLMKELHDEFYQKLVDLENSDDRQLIGEG